MAKSQASKPANSIPDFSAYLENSLLNFWYWDLQKDEMSWAKGTFELFEAPYKKADMLPTFRQALSADEDLYLMSSKEYVLASGRPTFDFKLNVHTAKGNPRWIEVRGESVKQGDTIIGLFGICHDVSHLRQTDAELKIIQTKTRIGFWHVQNGIVHWSRAIRDMMGFQKDDPTPTLDQWISSYVVDEDQKRVKDRIKNAAKENIPSELLFKQRTPDGQIMIVRSVLMTSPYQKGRVIGSFQDVTREIDAQQEVEAQSHGFDSILQTMIVGVAKVNMQGIITFANEAAMRYLEDPNMLGRYHVSEVIDQITPEGKKIPTEKLPLSLTLKKGVTVKSFHHGLYINGKLKWFSVNSAPVMADGKQTGAIANFIEITEEIAAQQLLKDSEARFRRLIHEAPFAIQIYDKDGNLIEANGEWETVWETDRSGAIGWYNIHKDKRIDALGFRDQVAQAYSGKRGEFTNTFAIPNNDPTKFKHLNTRFFPILNADGSVDNVVVFNDDVTEKVMAEKQLQESEEKFKAVAENLQGVTYMVHDEPFEMLYINKAAKEVTGYAPADFLSGKINFLTLIHPNDARRIASERSAQMQGRRKFVIEYQLQRKNKKWIWVRDTGMGVYADDGSLKYVVGYFEDITESKWAFEEIRLNESRFRTMFEDSGHGIGITDRNGRFVDVNKKLCEILGYSSDELIRKMTMQQVTHPEDYLTNENLLKKLVKGDLSSYQLEKRYVGKMGRIVHTRLNVSKYNDPETGELRVIGTVDDITESRKAEEAVRRSEKKFRSLFENAGHGIAIANEDGLIVEVNLRALKMFGYSREEMEGKLTVLDITHEDDKASTEERLTKLARGKTKTAFSEKRYVRKNGEAFWVAVSSSLFQDPSTGETMMVGNIEDISDKRTILQEIRANEMKFRSVFEETGHGIAIMDQDHLITTTNKKFREILGYTSKDIKSGVRTEQITHPDFQQLTQSVLRQLATDTSATIQEEVRYLHKKGHSIWVRLNGSSYFDPISSQIRFVWIIEDITKGREAIEQLRSSEEFQHETINALSIGLMVMQTSGRIEQTNKIWDQMVEPSKVLKKAVATENFLQLIKDIPLGARISVGLAAVINDHSPLFELELGMETNRWFAMRASKLHSKFDSVVITLQDITVRKRVEQALEESLSKYRNIYNITPVMMHSIDKQGTLVSVSNFWLEKLGYQRHEVIGKKLREFLTPESRKDADIILPVFFEKGSIFDVTYHFVTRSGEIIETLLSAIEEGKGTQHARSLAVVTDITPLKKAERQLKKNRQDLLEAQSIARIGNYELDIENRLFSSSAVFDDILEITQPGQKKFDLLKELAPESDYPHLYNVFKKALISGQNLDYVGPIRTLESNKTVWLACLGRLIHEEGKPAKLIGTIQDVTKSKTAEIEIQKLSDRLKLAMEGANIGVWEADLVTDKIHWEATMYDLFQEEPPITYDSWKILRDKSHPDDLHILAKMREDLANGLELIDYDYRMILPDGIHHFRAITRQIKGSSGIPERMVGVVIDITRDRELLKRLEQSLSEKDILIKEVHHRVKNNMQMISSILSLKSLDLEDEGSKRVFDDCTVRIKSMAVVHDQLYRFYNVSEIDISEYFHHLLSGLNALMGGRSGDYVIDIKADEFKMDVDMALLCGLIVSELVANAFKHGFKGHKEGLINVSFKIRDDKRILTVTNTGNRMPDDVLEIKTSSLGMSLIKTFTTQLGGKLEIHPDNGLQITF